MKTTSRTIVLFVLGVPALARAAEDDWNMRDTLLTEAAAVPARAPSGSAPGADSISRTMARTPP
ncbi:hypothetical protein ACN28S_39090 [Cystobacter fuscus]